MRYIHNISFFVDCKDKYNTFKLRRRLSAYGKPPISISYQYDDFFS